MNLATDFAAVFAITACLLGCASYRPAPLPDRPNLAAGLSGLYLTIPSAAAAHVPPHTIDIAKPLAIDEIGLLAILNDPDLKSERGTLGVARAAVLQATLLPNPSANFAYGALIGGPGTASSIAASLSQDIAALVTRGARINAARADLGQVEADQLWREWQVAQKARQLAVDIESADRAIDLTRHEHRLLLGEASAVKSAITKGNLTVSSLAPLLTAIAAAKASLQTSRLARLTNWQALNALLGLVPSARFAIATPVFSPLPAELEPFVSALPERRPDLAALRLGYRSAEENVRAAILGQFPAFTLGGFYGSDTTKVVSAGPSFTLTLPVFDRNQANIAKSRATRLLLREEYQARLDSAVANIHGLAAQLKRLEADLVQAHQAADAAATLAAAAQRAYAQGNLDERTLTDYETTSLERAVEVVGIQRQIAEDRIFLAVELGLGLPPVRIAVSSGAALQ